MAKFRKKPVVVSAFRFYPHITTEELYQWAEISRLTGHGISGLPVPFRFADGAIYIATLEGEMKANPGDWIIKGVKGEFYPCKPDIFAATYEAVEERSDEPR